MKTVGVFFGGRSNEHEISVITGMYAANLLRGAGYAVVPVYLPRTGGMTYAEGVRAVSAFRKPSFPPVFLRGRALWYEKRPKKRAAELDRALNCCHGGEGEGGVLSALLSWNGVPSASPGLAASALFLDKTLTKIALRGMGIPTARGFSLREGGTGWREEARELGYPVIVKPARLGSSIGIAVAKTEEELEGALADAFRLDGAVLVEEYLDGRRDLNCAVCRIGGELRFSPVEEVFSSSEILSFSEKYRRGEGASRIPAEIPEEAAAKIRSFLGRAYEQFGMRGVVRGDFLLIGEEVYFNELNTVPGSLSAYLFSDSLTGARDFLASLVEEAGFETPAKEIVSSGILEESFGKGRKMGQKDTK